MHRRVSFISWSALELWSHTRIENCVNVEDGEGFAAIFVPCPLRVRGPREKGHIFGLEIEKGQKRRGRNRYRKSPRKKIVDS